MEQYITRKFLLNPATRLHITTEMLSKNARQKMYILLHFKVKNSQNNFWVLEVRAVLPLERM